MVDLASTTIRRQSLPVATIDKAVFFDTALSIAARGLMGVLCCLDDEAAEIDETALSTASGIPIDQVLELLAELEKCGHVATGEAARHLIEEQRRQDEAEMAARPVSLDRSVSLTSVVYYLRRADGAIKIGFSKNLASRLRVLEKRFGPLVTLHKEPGGWHLEQSRHNEFSAERIRPNEEWFEPSARLLGHLELLARGLERVE